MQDIAIEEQIKMLQESLEAYNEAARELLYHTNDKQYHNLLENLHEKIIHLAEINKRFTETEKMNKEHFLQHHVHALEHANAHWQHTQHCFEKLTEAQEAAQDSVEHEELKLSMHRHLRKIEEEHEKLQYSLRPG